MEENIPIVDKPADTIYALDKHVGKLVLGIILKNNRLHKIHNKRLADKERNKIVMELNPELICDPNTLIDTWLNERDNNGIILYGEDGHHGGGVLDYESELIESIAQKRPINMVYLEEDESMMPKVEEYFRTGEMDIQLEDYLRNGFVRIDSTGHDKKLNLVIKCRELGIPLEFVDKNSLRDRDSDWYNKIKGKIGEKVDGIYIVISGSTHVSLEPIMHHNNITEEPGTTLGYLLKKQYGKNVLSVLSTNRNTIPNTGSESVIPKRFDMDLGRINDDRLRVAIKLKGSPYEGRLMSSGNRNIGSDSYDVMVSAKGDYLSKA